MTNRLPKPQNLLYSINMAKEYLTSLFEIIIKIIFRFFIKNDFERENMILRKEEAKESKYQQY